MTFLAVILFGLGFAMLSSAIEGVSLSETTAALLTGVSVGPPVTDTQPGMKGPR